MKEFIIRKKAETCVNSFNNSPTSPALEFFDNLSPWNDSDKELKTKLNPKKIDKENIPPTVNKA